jgi:DNA-binding transcriptional regulator YdaS (Cro superfamily)
MRVNPLWLALGEDHPKIGFAPADMSGIPGDEPFLPVMTAIEKNYTLHRRQFFEISKSAELAFSQSRGIPVPSDSNVEPLSEKLLTLTFSSDTGKSVPPLDDRMLWNELRARLRSATNHYGGKTKLAQLFGVTPQAVTQWLSRNSKVTPTAETTLRLLEWVQREEAKPKKRTGSAETRPALKTRNQKALSHDKPKSGP